MASSETHDVSSTQENTKEVTCGRVKWFNNKAGYGFITVSTDGKHKGEDVFVHHSAIQVKQEQYRYLVQGEYVNFKLCSVTNDVHKWQAADVSGVDGGCLMCETRLESRGARTINKEESGQATRVRTSNRDNEQPPYRIRTRGSGPREGEEWMLVRRRSTDGHGRSSNIDSQSKDAARSRNAGRRRVLNNSEDS